jgi:hypothetical protein
MAECDPPPGFSTPVTLLYISLWLDLPVLYKHPESLATGRSVALAVAQLEYSEERSERRKYLEPSLL